MKLVCASELYDDIIIALRSDSVRMPVVVEMLRDLRRLSHEILPTTVDVAEEAMRLYADHGGSLLFQIDRNRVIAGKIFSCSIEQELVS